MTIYAAMTARPLPVVGLIAAIALVVVALCWPRASNAAPMADEVSFADDIQPLVTNFCATCHHGADPEGGFVLDTYADVRRHTEKGELLARIHDAENPMPPAGLLPVQHRRLFKAWADGGYKRKGRRRPSAAKPDRAKFVPPTIRPVDVRKDGFDFLDRMQGHWVGRMNLMGRDFEWFAFDYRAIAPSHVHGLFEGGTIGNLFTSFFVADFRGTRTLMARNGGLLNGIYRTSYFVLDEVKRSSTETSFRFVDAYGGKRIMWMELTFAGEELRFRAYTSRMGLFSPPRRHMSFTGRRRASELARAAAKAVGYPKNVVERRFPRGLPKANWGSKHEVTSASYMSEEKGKSLVELGKLAGDPIRVDQMPRLGSVKLSVKRPAEARGKKLVVLLSEKALVDAKGRYLARHGYVREELLETTLLFPRSARARASSRSPTCIRARTS